MQPCRTDH